MSSSRALIAALCLAAVSAWAQSDLPDGPLSLGAATAYALSHNPNLLGSEAEVSMAQFRRRLTAAEGRLRASIHGYASAGTVANMVTGLAPVMPDDMQMMDPGRRYDLGLSLYYPLSTGGRVSADVQRAEHAAAATQAEARAMRLEVTYTTRAAYRMALLRRKLVEVYERELAAREEMLRVDTVRYEAGKIPLYYVLRDRSALAEAQQNLTNAQRDVEVALYDLALVMGLDQPRELELSDVMGYAPVEVERAGSLAAAAAGRPELAATRARLAAAAAEVDVARSAYHPQVAAKLLLDGLGADGEGASGGYTAAVVLSLPLLDGGERGAEVGMAQAQVRQLTQRERRVAQEITRQVLTALANLQAADRNTRTAMEAQAAAEEDHRVALLRYDAAKAINLEPLDALASLTRARLSLAQAMYDFANAADDLAWAEGRLPTGAGTTP